MDLVRVYKELCHGKMNMEVDHHSLGCYQWENLRSYCIVHLQMYRYESETVFWP